jgi:hypothetical protein
MNSLISFLKFHVISSLARRYFQFRNKKLKKIFFLATTGRSGTATLVDILNHLPNCKAEHEPYPAMFNDVLRAKSSGNENYVKNEYWQVKSINLYRAAAGYEYYLESNHMFIKTYIEYAVQDFKEKIVIIHLVRDPIKVANSIYSLQDYPGTIEGNRWWLDYTAPGNFIKIADILDNDSEFEHPFYKGLWYWYEMERRIAYWKEKLPNVQFIKFLTEDFNIQEKVFQLLIDLGISFDEKQLASKVATQSNTRLHQKIVEPLPMLQAEEMHMKFKSLIGISNS